jgi:hypothetical protein
MADISLINAENATRNKWSYLIANNVGGSGSGGILGATDTIFLTDTGATLTLDGAEDATYTCAAVKCAGPATPLVYDKHGHIAITTATGVGPTLNFEMYAGCAFAAMLPLTSGTIKSIKKVVGGSYFNSTGITASVGTFITEVVEAVGGSSPFGTYGVHNSGTIALVKLAKGGSADTSAGIFNAYNYTIARVNLTRGSATHAAAGITNSGTITLLDSTIGGDISGSHGSEQQSVMGPATITTLTRCEGGSVTGAYGIYNDSIITNPIGTAKGGTNANPALCITAFGIVSLSPNAISINTVDNTGTCPAVGLHAALRLPAHAWVGSYDAAGTAAQVHIPTGTVVSPAGVLENLPRWSGSSSLGTYVAINADNALKLSAGHWGAGSTLNGKFEIPDEDDVIKAGTPYWGVDGTELDGNYVEVDETNVVHGVNYGVGLTGSFSGAGTDPSDEVGPFPSDTTQVGPYPYASGKVGPYKLVE